MTRIVGTMRGGMGRGRRRRGRSRLIGLLAGGGLIAGLCLLDWTLPPVPQGLAGAAGVPAMPAAIPDPPTVAFASSQPAGIADRLIGDIAAPAPGLLPDAPPAEPAQMVEARPGDTPLKLLTRIGVVREDAQEAVKQLGTVWDLRDLRAGQKAAVFVQSDRLLSLRLVLAPGRDIVVARDDTGRFVAEDQNRPTREVPALGAGTIHTSLSEAANRAGVPAAIVGEMIRAFSYDVDFQREVRSGDSFTVLYQRVDDEFGQPAGAGHMVYAELVLSGTRLRLFRFSPSGGEVGYYNPLGENIRKPLLRTPVDAIRITSGFGMRQHPILGYSRMHQGVDFAAPSGTAIYAAGDGVVVEAARVSGYGNYIEIEHNPQYATAYGHLSAFARGLHNGQHVRQGEVIGYVGMTGMATGPHLHYEVHYQGAPIDPLSVKMPALTRLAGSDLKAFGDGRSEIERLLIELRQELVARVECGAQPC